MLINYNYPITKAHIFMLSVLMLGVTAFSIFYLAPQSLRLDESQSLWQISNSVPRIINIVAQDVHVPFYHLSLHFWLFYTQQSVFFARLFSLIFAVLTIPAVYVLGKKAFNPKIALFAAALTAISPFLVWYGSEIRMYSLLTFLTVINQIFFLEIYRSNRFLSWAGFVITAILALYTHYFFALILFSEFLFVLFYKKYFAPHAVRNFIIANFLVVLALAPWAYYVYSVSTASYAEPLLIKPTVTNLFLTFSQFLFGYQSDQFNRFAISLWPLAVLLGFLAMSRKHGFSFEATYFFMAIMVPIFLAFVISQMLVPLYLSRYLILTTPSLYLLLTWLFAHYSEKMEKVLKVAVMSVMIVTLVNQTISAATPVKEDFRDSAIYLNQNAQPQDIILVSAPFTIYPVEYYYTGPAQIKTIPEWDRFVVGPIPAFSPEVLASEVDSLKSTHQRVWVLLSYDQGYQEQIRNYFETNFQRLDQQQFTNDIQLSLYQLRYDIPD